MISGQLANYSIKRFILARNNFLTTQEKIVMVKKEASSGKELACPPRGL